MKDLMAEEVETNANSPCKIFKQTGHAATHPHPHQHHSPQLSLTEKELYSRGIVREVMRAQQHRTVKHDIHRIPLGTPLYATPKPPINTGLKFASIPPSDRLYSSVCSAKIRHISTAMAHRPLQGKAYPSSPAAHDPNISVSGLVTYKFSSVSAQRAVGLGQVDRVQHMQQQLSAIRLKRQCAQTRQQSILSRSSSKRREVKTQQAEQEGGISTERYLKQVLRSQQENAVIYNQRANKLRFIKELMREDGLPYDDAHHIVQQIQDIHEKVEGRAEGVVAFAGVDEEEEMRHRRISLRKKRVMVRFQTFAD